MRDHLLQIARSAPVEARRNLAREYLQVYILRVLHEHGAYQDLVFQGGTALRLIHGVPRFSEDLDFSSSAGSTDPSVRSRVEELLAAVKDDCVGAGYAVTAKVKGERAVVAGMLRFTGLPAAVGWSSDPRVALSVKVEVDCEPPAGGQAETTLVQRFFPVALRHHDLPSLFAGKLHALLTRPWAKGRDWFDLVWYLTQHAALEPNLVLLANALSQTGADSELANHWRDAVRERLRGLNWGDLTRDVLPFLERPSDWGQLEPDLVDRLLAGPRVP